MLTMGLNRMSFWPLAVLLSACTHRSECPTDHRPSRVKLGNLDDVFPGHTISRTVLRLNEDIRQLSPTEQSGWAKVPQEIVNRVTLLSIRERVEQVALRLVLERPITSRWSELLAGVPEAELSHVLVEMLDECSGPAFGLFLITATDRITIRPGLRLSPALAAALHRRVARLDAEDRPSAEELVSLMEQAQ